MIEPRTLKGFRDFLPAAMIPRERLMETARRVYRSYGFAPIDTPALEYTEILLGKGGAETDKQMFRFEDSGGRDVAMRFDLTVPLARFVAQHAGTLGMPFKRYHIATVWRGENTQRGRYREFMQCDFDTIGTRSIAADIETTLVIHELFLALGFTDFEIHVNNRKVLTGLLEKLQLADKSTFVLRALDKLAKIGPAKVSEELTSTTGASPEQAAAILEFATLTGTNDAIVAGVARAVAGSAVGEQGVGDLRSLLAACAAAGLPDERLKLDVSIARGLDYYTGTIYETFLTHLPSIGSVCSGGRYDNLAGLYTKQELPGVGASLGLDRLLAAMEELDMLPTAATPAEVFVAYFDAERLHDYLRLAAAVRGEGIGVELFPEPKKLGQQLKYADQRGFRVALIAGSNELAAGQCQVKDLKSGGSETVAFDAVAAAVKKVLAGYAGERNSGQGIVDGA
ncbi:MAG: histidine--tRNA ligase [Pirellulales bacterium]